MNNHVAAKYEQVCVYVGPSRPSMPTPDFVQFYPPAQSGDFSESKVPPTSIVVFVDGLFFQTPPVTHMELLALLAKGRFVIGAGSMGALRAVELRAQGMIGLGSVYKSYLDGRLTDDSEIAVAVCPPSYKALTVPAIQIRRALAIAVARGLDINIVEEALLSALSIHFLERSIPNLIETWHCLLPGKALQTLEQLVRSPESDLKASDARGAIRVAIEIIKTGRRIEHVPQSEEIFISTRECDHEQ